MEEGEGKEKRREKEGTITDNRENLLDLYSTLVSYEVHSCRLFYLSFPIIL